MSDEKRWMLGPAYFLGPYLLQGHHLSRADVASLRDQADPEYNAAVTNLVEIVEEEQKLFDRLTELGRHFDGATSRGEQRQNALAALEAILRHLITTKAGRGSMIVLEALFADVENLHEGRQTAFLEPTPGTARRRGPKQRARQLEVLLAYASAAVDRLVEGGQSEQDAAGQVIREMKRRKLPLPPKQSNSNSGPPERLLTYRARLRSSPRLGHMTSTYFEAKEIISAEDPKKALGLLFDTIGQHITKVP